MTHLTPILCIQGEIGFLGSMMRMWGHVNTPVSYVVVLLLYASNLGLKEILQPIESWVSKGPHYYIT